MTTVSFRGALVASRSRDMVERCLKYRRGARRSCSANGIETADGTRLSTPSQREPVALTATPNIQTCTRRLRTPTTIVDHALVVDVRSFPPPPMRSALNRLSMFGTTALVNLARRNVTWFLSDYGDEEDLAELVVAAHLHCPPTSRAAAAHARFVVGRVRFPYMVVLRLDDQRQRSTDFIGLVGDVGAELRELLPNVTMGSGGNVPPDTSGGPPPTAAPAHAAGYVPPLGPPREEGAA